MEAQLREYYEEEAAQRLRPAHGERRTVTCERFVERLVAERRSGVVDIGSGPASDGEPFARNGILYVGVDLAVGNARIGAELDRIVVPGSLFDLPFRTHSFEAGWSMSTLQHVPDERIDEALKEFVRVLRPGAPVTLGLWGGRDEVIVSSSATSGLQLARHFTLRTHDRIREILREHMVVERDETFAAGPSDWEYHVAHARTPA